jgi:hypothetical protein
MHRLLLIVLAFVVVGCTERVERSGLPRLLADEAKPVRAKDGPGGQATVPLERRWRYAGTDRDRHIIIHQYAAPGMSLPTTRTLSFPSSEVVVPVAMGYTEDESRWIPLKEVRRTRADGTIDIDFARLSAAEIDAARDPSLGKDAVRRGGL